MFEAFQSMSEAPLSSCPKCGQGVRRMINGGMGVIFKGSGFYVTDNGGSKGSGGAKKSSSAPAPACEGCAKAEAAGTPKEKTAG
jgi:putative FmdB family regulatory protein